MDGMDKNKTFLIVGLGLLGGKYAQVLSQKGYRVTGITHSQSTLDYALEHAYICEGRNELCCWNGSSSTATWSAPAR